MQYETRYERDYLERTIETVRNHRDAENCWPQWANIFASEIERLWKIEDLYSHAAEAFSTGDYEAMEDALRG